MKPVLVAVVALLGFVLWFGPTGDGYGGVPAMDNETLINLARQIAADHNVDVDRCEVHLGRQGRNVIVEFSPRHPDQLGGGARLLFEEGSDRYVFREIELWQ